MISSCGDSTSGSEGELVPSPTINIVHNCNYCEPGCCVEGNIEPPDGDVFVISANTIIFSEDVPIGSTFKDNLSFKSGVSLSSDGCVVHTKSGTEIR